MVPVNHEVTMWMAHRLPTLSSYCADHSQPNQAVFHFIQWLYQHRVPSTEQHDRPTHTKASHSVLKAERSVHFSNTVASMITAYMMFSVFLKLGQFKNCCLKHCSSFLLRSITFLLWVFYKFLEPNRHLIMKIYSDTHDSFQWLQVMKNTDTLWHMHCRMTTD